MKTQNWTAVGIDFFIVVVGVFIGIQVANWNDVRGDRERESQYLDDLRSNLIEDRGEYANVRQTTVARIGAINFIMKQALDEAPPTGNRSTCRGFFKRPLE